MKAEKYVFIISSGYSSALTGLDEENRLDDDQTEFELDLQGA